MPRGVKKERVYTGKALKIYEKVQKLESDLASAKEELKAAYKEQLKAERAEAAKLKKEEAALLKKKEQEEQAKLLQMIKDSGKSIDEIMNIISKTN